MSALCRFEMLLPLRFNDGSEVPRELVSETINELAEQFNGVTWETQVLHGRWRHEGKTYQDELLRILVDAEGSEVNRDFFREFKKRLKSRFRQFDIWLTVVPIET